MKIKITILFATEKLYQTVFNSTNVKAKKTKKVGINMLGGNFKFFTELLKLIFPAEGILKNIIIKSI